MPRLDALLFQKGMFPSREKARRAVMAGLIEVEGTLIDKPGTAVSGDADLVVKGPREPFVSRAGRKLDAALEHFGLDPKGWICADIGASTGGFTDCLLQRGATKVYAVDVGYGQLDHGLRQDPRVVVMERTNARYLEADVFAESVDLVTIDVSFISAAKIVPAALGILADGGRILSLVKPQFEAGKGRVGKGGVVRDRELRRQVIDRTVEAIEAEGTTRLGLVDSAVPGAKGNREAFALFIKGGSR